MNIPFPFVGRAREIARLQRLHAQRRHVLILGAEGLGKSALVVRLRPSLRLFLCPVTERLSAVCDALEHEMGLDAGGLNLTARKNRILDQLQGVEDVVVFDGLGRTPPRLASFIENVARRVPVWLCARSERPWDIGHLWPLPVRFEVVELKPFRRRESQELVEAAVRTGRMAAETLNYADGLHRRSAGNPKILTGLLAEMARGHYDLNHSQGWARLDLGCRIREIFPDVSGKASG